MTERGTAPAAQDFLLGGAAAAAPKASKKCGSFEEGPRRAADPQQQAERALGAVRPRASEEL